MSVSIGRLERLAMIATACGIGLFAPTGRADPMPLIHAHAHNDYEHARPLFDALDRGFCSVEADIYLVDGQLLAEEKQKLREFVKQAHQQDRRIRFWGAPDNAQAWLELDRVGVDLLTTDDLAGVQKFFAGQKTGRN